MGSKLISEPILLSSGLIGFATFMALFWFKMSLVSISMNGEKEKKKQIWKNSKNVMKKRWNKKGLKVNKKN